MSIKKAIPILYASDVRASLVYFREQLKFESVWEWDDEASFGGAVTGDVEIFFCKGDQGNPATWLSIVVENVDEYYDQIKDSGAVILHPPKTYAWNMREMLVQCPDGHMIRIGHNTDCD
jgi:uncharacterized glyoxalase superfamily protein PhnB